MYGVRNVMVLALISVDWKVKRVLPCSMQLPLDIQYRKCYGSPSLPSLKYIIAIQYLIQHISKQFLSFSVRIFYLWVCPYPVNPFPQGATSNHTDWGLQHVRPWSNWVKKSKFNCETFYKIYHYIHWQIDMSNFYTRISNITLNYEFWAKTLSRIRSIVNLPQ